MTAHERSVAVAAIISEMKYASTGDWHKQTRAEIERAIAAAEQEARESERVQCSILVERRVRNLGRNWIENYGSDAVPWVDRLLGSNIDTQLGDAVERARVEREPMRTKDEYR